MSLSFQNRANDAQQLIAAALQAANPATAVSNYLRKEHNNILVDNQAYSLENGRIFLICVGKAAIPMAESAVVILGDSVHAGICLTKESEHLQHPRLPNSMQFYTGEHPVSGEKSIAATTAIANLLSQTTANDIVLCLISGGCSALLTQPLLPLADWQTLNKALLASGCSINDFNIVRRQLDAVKGGGLAQWAAPAQVATLILSDVIGNDLKAIGSGPTVPTTETGAAATAVLEKYKLHEQLPASIWAKIEKALKSSASQVVLNQVQNKIIGDVQMAAQAMAKQAEAIGFAPTILTTHLEGEAKEAGRFAAALAKDLQPANCLILGGETTVTLTGNGIGGRNLEVALSASIGIENEPNTLIFTLATDGDDGPTHCAGAMVTGMSVENGRNQNLDAQRYLANNDSYTYFSHLPNHLIKTGPTGTNVNDLICILKYTD